MTSGIAILIMVIVFAVFGIVGVLVFLQIKKTDPSNVDTSLRTNNDTTQETLPFEDIKDSMIHLGEFRYRAVIVVSSLNYNLKTEKEQDVIELSYQRFLNSLTHPIQMVVYTKIMDYSPTYRNMANIITTRWLTSMTISETIRKKRNILLFRLMMLLS